MICKKYLLIIFMLILFSTGCNSPKMTVNDQSKTQSEGAGIIISYNVADLVAMPDEIIFYHKGISTIINKDNNNLAYNYLSFGRDRNLSSYMLNYYYPGTISIKGYGA